MRAEFHRADVSEDPVGTARWTGSGVKISAEGREARDALGRIFQPTPVMVEDPSVRTAGTTGPTVFQPGSLQWFRAAARVRAAAEGLTASLVGEDQGAMGWDPAGAYRTFTDAIERKALIGGTSEEEEGEAGEERYEGMAGPSHSGTEAASPAPATSAAAPPAPPTDPREGRGGRR